MKLILSRKGSEVANAKDLKPSSLKVLIYGPAGTGKTELASTFPRPHFVDLDDGMLTVMGKDVEYFTVTRRPPDDPDYIKLFGDKCLKWDAFTRAQKITEHWANTLTEKDTLIIDSFSFLNDYALDSVLKTENQAKPRIQDWGTAQKMLETTLEALNNTNCNLIVIAHEQFTKDEESGIISWLPATIGKLATKIPIYFDEVWRSFAEQGKGANKDTYIYGIETKPTRRTTAKSRLKLPKRIEDVTYDKIMELKFKGDK